MARVMGKHILEYTYFIPWCVLFDWPLQPSPFYSTIFAPDVCLTLMR
jgi:hypothetical protein